VQLGESKGESAPSEPQPGAPPPAEIPPPRLPTRRALPQRLFIERLVLGHFIAYPVGLLAAVASMPIGMKVRARAVLGAGSEGAKSDLMRQIAHDLGLTPLEAAQTEIVMVFVMWATLAVMLVVHLAVLPWAIGAARDARSPDPAPSRSRRGLRSFAIVTAVTLVVVMVCGAAGWIWLFTL